MIEITRRRTWVGAFVVTTLIAASAVTGCSDDAADDDNTVRIGYVNNEGGALSLPEFRIGGEVAVEKINGAGGVNGRRVKIVKCLADGSPEASINCANTLIDARVAVAYTGIDISSDAALPLYVKANIPYVTSNSWGTAQRTSKGAFLLHTATSAYVVGPLRLLQQQGAKKVAVLTEQSSDAQKMMDTLVAPAAKKLGLTFKPVLVDPANPDWTQAVTTALSSQPDGIVAQLTEENCVGMVTALRTARYDKPIMAGSCTAYVQALGKQAVGTYVFTDLYAPETRQYAPPEIQQRLGAYESAMRAAGQTQYINGFAVVPYSSMFELADILRTIPAGSAITTERVFEAFRAAKTSPGHLGSDLHCGAPPYPAEPANCRADVLVFKVVERTDGSVGKEPVGQGFQPIGD
ncbi:ABC transporter substrate-binding protein [Virgisporangium aurantiacum]|uniref:Leucine-binding protein domain-containing protein n=1 Tax=Virgisporangium aurantiacum TaxID=175570 RepID=A0A8J3ZKK0_9ACTN|nr:ABC transporter substrate-binding protein [Virgisporangium aurantiacum]GIJ63201.1 hypothetical protein Vau01_107170 [Virgisporangium aurantiacum]